MGTLDDILSDDGVETAAPVVAEVETVQPEIEQQAVNARPRDEAGKFAPKGVEEGAPPAPKQDQLPPDEYKALRAERERRQALEAEIAQLKAQQAPQIPAPSIWEDEQGAFSHFGNQIAQQAVQQASLNARLDMSEMMVRQANPDFEEMKAVFVGLMQENPALQQQALADPHPWNKAYQIAKNYRAMQELGATDVAGLEAKLREKIMAEMQTAPKVEQPIPTSLADAQSARGGSAVTPSPLSLDDIIKMR